MSSGQLEAPSVASVPLCLQLFNAGCSVHNPIEGVGNTKAQKGS